MQNKDPVKRKRRASVLMIAFAAVFIIISISLALYPTISQLINRISNRNRNAAYSAAVNTLSEKEKAEILDNATQYNIALGNPISSESKLSYKDTEDYTSVLNFSDGQMGSVLIPTIDVNLPIYHGTGEDKLSMGAVHLPNSSLPVGGIGTHCCISAHTAYPGKIFFDNINKLEKGDCFYIQILDEIHTYKITEKNIVDPNDSGLLQIDYDKDLVTLITCYPYAVNSHRLLVTGERIESDKEVTIEDIQTDHQPYREEKILLAIGGVAVLIILIATTILILKKRTRKKHVQQEQQSIS